MVHVPNSNGTCGSILVPFNIAKFAGIQRARGCFIVGYREKVHLLNMKLLYMKQTLQG